jgi:plasmid replication initiation protein
MDEDFKNKIIKKSNVLISAKCKLGVNEQKILYRVISLIHINDKDFKDYEIKIVDIIDFLGVKNKNVHSEIKKYVKNLVKELLVFQENEKEVYTHWFSLAEYQRVDYKNEKQTIVFNFHPRLKPYLIDLKSHFTRFGIENIRRFKNKYSPRLYEIFKQFEDTGYRVITVKDLRYILSLEDKYKNYNDFKKNAILVPLQEINETDITISFKEIKEGKIIDRLYFNIQKTVNPGNNTGEKSSNNIKANFEKSENSNNITRNPEDKKADLSNDKVNKLRKKIKSIIDDEIKDKKIIQWLEAEKENDIDFYLDNWSRWKWKTKTTKAGFFIDLVDNKRPIPSGEKGIRVDLEKPPQAKNYEQREYSDEFLNSLYDNVTFVKD